SDQSHVGDLDYKGAVHPNQHGQQLYKRKILEAMRLPAPTLTIQTPGAVPGDNGWLLGSGAPGGGRDDVTVDATASDPLGLWLVGTDLRPRHTIRWAGNDVDWEAASDVTNHAVESTRTEQTFRAWAWSTTIRKEGVQRLDYTVSNLGGRGSDL